MTLIKFVVTAVKNGQRTLAESRNHLKTYDTEEIAQTQLDNILKHNSPETIEHLMGTDLQVRQVECFSTGDPMTCWFDNDLTTEQEDEDFEFNRRNVGDLEDSE